MDLTESLPMLVSQHPASPTFPSLRPHSLALGPIRRGLADVVSTASGSLHAPGLPSIQVRNQTSNTSRVHRRMA